MAPVIERRKFLLGLAAAGLGSVPALGEGSTSPNDPLPSNWRQLGFPTRRWVSAVFVNTGEPFHTIYCENGEYIYSSIKEFSWVCRDYRLNQWKWLHPMLLDLLFVLHWKYNRNKINITSGYRTPETNAKIEGTALHSQHTLGMALDVNLPDVDNTAVASDFQKIFKGGVGMYPLKRFTHLDCGPYRTWDG